MNDLKTFLILSHIQNPVFVVGALAVLLPLTLCAMLKFRGRALHVVLLLTFDILVCEFTRAIPIWQRIGGILEGILIVIILFLSLGRFRLSFLRHERAFVFFTIWGLVGTLLGIIQGNEFIYIVSDTYKILFLFFVYIISVSNIPKGKSISIMFAVALLLSLVGIHMLLLRVFTIYNIGVIIRVGGISMFPVVFFLIAGFATRGGSIEKRLTQVLFFLVVALLLLLSSRRAVVGGILIVLYSLMSVKDKSLFFSRLSGFLFFTAPVAIFILWLLPSESFVEMAKDTYNKFISTYSYGEVEPSAYVRVYEVKKTVSLGLSSPVTFLIGHGSGAEYYSGRAAAGGSGHNLYYDRDFLIHNIHNVYSQVFFRYGAVGLTIFLVFGLRFFSFLKELEKNQLLTYEYRNALKIIKIFFAYMFIVEFNTISTFFHPFYFGVLLAIPRVISNDLSELKGGHGGAPH